jgi:hypothetical protein
MAARRSKVVHDVTTAGIIPHVFHFDELTHTYSVDGTTLVSVTQVLNEERFIDFSMVPNGTLQAAQFRGTYVHRVLHLYLENDYDLGDCDGEYRGYVNSALRYLDALKKTPLEASGIEYRFWETSRMYAGTMDYLGHDADGVLSIDDWKTGEPEDVAAALQTAAYENGVRRCLFPNYDGPIRRRAVKLFRDGSPARAEIYNDPRDLSMFFTALSCVHFRRNRLRHPGGL